MLKAGTHNFQHSYFDILQKFQQNKQRHTCNANYNIASTYIDT